MPTVTFGDGGWQNENQNPTPHWKRGAIPKRAVNRNVEPSSDTLCGAGDSLPVAECALLEKIIRRGLVENKHDLEIQRRNPNSPLYSIKSFEALNLKPELLKGIYAIGYNAPSKIQETALPTLLANPPQNVIAQAQSGTGKTAAFVLTMLSRVDPEKNYPQVLCLSPTYELARQTGDVTEKMAQFCPLIRVSYAIRGEHVTEPVQSQIVIGTPGKVLDWTMRCKFFDLSKIKVFILDEADVMIATQGHQDQSIRVHKNLPQDCQMVLFSATYDTDVMQFAEAIISNPITMRLKREEETLDNIKQYYTVCNNASEKYRAISNIYSVVTIGQAIIFCHTRKAAAWLSRRMSEDGHVVSLLSGELTVAERIAVLDRFRRGVDKILITTNVLSRGIDIEQVTIVVNFDIPVDLSGKADCETYLHRIGRTGRFGKPGIALNLIANSKNREVLMDIERHFDRTIMRLDAENVDEIEKLNN